MLNNTNKIKVLLYGNIHIRDYRSKLAVKFLQDLEFRFTQVCPGYYRNKPIEKFLSIEKFLIVFVWMELLLKAAFADLIYVLPMNARFIKSAVWIAKLLRKQLAVEMYISMYDTLVKDRELVKSGSRQANAWKHKDILALTKADYIIHTSQHELTYWETLLGIKIDPQKVFVAPICNIPRALVKREFMQDGVLNICWWGTFIPLHGLDNILKAMQILQEKAVPFTCNLFGVNNSAYTEYANKIQTYQLEKHVSLRKDLSFADDSLTHYLVDNCDLALGIFGNTEKARHAMPNKLAEALSMGIPSLTMKSSALNEFFDPEVDFWTCEPSPASIAEAILQIAAGTAYPVNWEQTRQKALNTFSAARYSEVLNQVIEKAADKLPKPGELDVDSRVLANPQTLLSQQIEP